MSENSNIDEVDYGPLCTFAVTGPTAHFQAIYVCHTCSFSKQRDSSDDDGDKNGMPLCICFHCAEICHEQNGHEIEYYGDGPSYCDCSSFFKDCDTAMKKKDNSIPCSCALKEASYQMAKKLNIVRHSEEEEDKDNNIHDGQTDSNLDLQVYIQRKEDNNPSHRLKFPYVCDVFDIPTLRPRCNQLVLQSLELIKHTRDTHWVSLNNNIGRDGMAWNELCKLEQLAYSICQRHIVEYDLMNVLDNSLSREIGAEWWVQVKKVNDEPCGENKDDKESNANANEAIDLHYDKDEELAAAFDIGSFPTLSTVTYLTEAYGRTSDGESLISAPPTIVFAHTHEMANDGPLGQIIYPNNGDVDNLDDLPQMMVSHAKEGKHLCFDGRLLHGAAANVALRKKIPINTFEFEEQNGYRVTFLVNIWLSRRPSRVVPLSNEIRMAIKSCESILSKECYLSTLEMSQKPIDICAITTENKVQSNNWINLPFVSKNATWADEDEDEDSGLVVSIIPPQQLIYSDTDTIFAFYEDDIKPKLKFIDGDDGEDFEEE
jgi:hypothetical protein